MHPYLPQTEQDIKNMLDTIGLKSIDDLFNDVPESMRMKKELDLPKAKSEIEVRRIIGGMAAKNLSSNDVPTFMGAGLYDHYIPSVIAPMISRGEFLTSYTPYQPEVSQGTLQYIFEFQSLLCELTGMTVANASVYDHSNAVAETAIMCANVSKKNQILVSKTLNPDSVEVLYNYAKGHNLEVVLIEEKDGITDLEDLKAKLSDETACVMVQSPNFFGIIEDLEEAAEITHTAKKASFVAAVDPISLGILKRPGDIGADVVIGEGQALGIPVEFGGPSLGFMCTTDKFLRKLPGRIVGQTVDKNGNRCFVLTLTAREQHIRREKATSNICSNQGVNTLSATMYMCLLGKEGLKEVAMQSLSKAHYLQKKLEEKGYPLKWNQPFFKEFVVEGLTAEKQRELLKDKKFIGGFGIKRYYEKYDNVMFAVTEQRTKEEMDEFAEVLGGK
ncbi:MAG: aminomethyl-transferring glycine dehydrogenase subunit GcvPA [Ezakiella sp.]|nr:aminomethyl-transferring glycine dehydrogenase subunit GcvPA [Ezakiella sp.]MDD7472292.1 aminomethyl-transferring glycine dehydrogenase subunit GcvPA [Bacillota bacterium]MDY3923030.1 aminomethyl-transferring glycine dehydrogenase subunit GcvPA [Ezakiella sp.]